jgi:hypothetical protein
MGGHHGQAQLIRQRDGAGHLGLAFRPSVPLQFQVIAVGEAGGPGSGKAAGGIQGIVHQRQAHVALMAAGQSDESPSAHFVEPGGLEDGPAPVHVGAVGPGQQFAQRRQPGVSCTSSSMRVGLSVDSGGATQTSQPAMGLMPFLRAPE